MVIGTLVETCQYDFLSEDAELDIDKIQEKNEAKRVLKMLEAIYKKANAKWPLNWADKMLLRLSDFAEELESAPEPESGVVAKLFYKIKFLVGKILSKLSEVLANAIGTTKRVDQINQDLSKWGY